MRYNFFENSWGVSYQGTAHIGGGTIGKAGLGYDGSVNLSRFCFLHVTSMGLYDTALRR